MYTQILVDGIFSPKDIADMAHIAASYAGPRPGQGASYSAAEGRHVIHLRDLPTERIEALCAQLLVKFSPAAITQTAAGIRIARQP